MKTISIIIASLFISLTGILKQMRLQVILILSILLFSGCNEFSQKEIKVGDIILPDAVQWLNKNSERYFMGLMPAVIAAAPSPTVPMYTNSLGMTLQRFEPGNFMMGAGSDMWVADSPTLFFDEQPAHPVILTEAFYVGTLRVSQAQFQQAGLGSIPADGRVSWNRAKAFCDWLSKKEGKNYRLLTEAEWEYVQRNPGMVEDFVGEWVNDWHTVYRNDIHTNPAGPSTGIVKVARADLANRMSLPPSVEGQYVFRVVMDTASPDRFVSSPLPFNQAAIKQSTVPALQGPDPSKPYFTVRFALPNPPANDGNMYGALLGLDPAAVDHNHSPALEVMPNGDVLAIWFSGPGSHEGGPHMRLIQARLRYGAEEWDMPELLLRIRGKNPNANDDVGPCLWREGNTNWLFTSWDRDVRDHQYLQHNYGRFRVTTSTDNGATWNMVVPEPTFKPTPSTGSSASQPVTNAFRAPNGDMYLVCDGQDGDPTSMLWRSPDNGLTWYDQGGRTGTRHTTIVPLDDTGRLLAVGGKDTQIRGFMPTSISNDWGKTWEEGTRSAFPSMGVNQRPSAIRLASGNIVMVGDAASVYPPHRTPRDWQKGRAPYVALSSDNGANWTIKELPVALPHKCRGNLTLGYSTVRQAPNGVIHILATMTIPGLHYELNEAWILDSIAGDIIPENRGGKIKSYSEKYPDGRIKATWKARICPNGRYLLDGLETHYYENGKKQREVSWVSGRRNGEETLWGPDGKRIWSWNHDLANNLSTWTHWWSNGNKRVESQWNTNPSPQDLPTRHFRGLLAHGTAKQYDVNGKEVGAVTFKNGVRTWSDKSYTETFATEPADWKSNGATTGGNNIGWSNTNNLLGRDSGEVRAIFARGVEYRYYADTNISPKNRTNSFHMAGKFRLRQASFNGTFYVGYFNASDPGNNFVGFAFSHPIGPGGYPFRARLTVKGSGGTSVEACDNESERAKFIKLYNGITSLDEFGVVGYWLPLEYDLTWNGNPDGSGRLRGTVGGKVISINVPAGSGTFNAFGFLVGGMPSDNPTKLTGECWFDDLTYDKVNK